MRKYSFDLIVLIHMFHNEQILKERKGEQGNAFTIN